MEDSKHTDSTHNFYEPPKTSHMFSESLVATKEPNTWYHLTGRIGRLRYVSYLVFAFMSFMMVAIFIAMIFENDYVAFIIVMFVILFWVFYYFIVWSRRRLHDLGCSSWLTLIFLIPFVNVLFALSLVFTKGNQEVNEYGLPSRPNKWSHYIFGLLLPLLVVISMVGVKIATEYQAYKIDKMIENLQQVEQ